MRKNHFHYARYSVGIPAQNSGHVEQQTHAVLTNVFSCSLRRMRENSVLGVRSSDEVIPFPGLVHKRLRKAVPKL
jgi:hypothetical protein